MGFVITGIIIFLILAAIGGAGNKEKAKLQAKLKADYDAAKTSGDKNAALKAGRLYYASLRDKAALTVYDEQALTNDLASMPEANGHNVVDELAKLKSLLDIGAISGEEFEVAKKKILS